MGGGAEDSARYWYKQQPQSDEIEKKIRLTQSIMDCSYAAAKYIYSLEARIKILEEKK